VEREVFHGNFGALLQLTFGNLGANYRQSGGTISYMILYEIL
jgi:hypothetical protein